MKHKMFLKWYGFVALLAAGFVLVFQRTVPGDPLRDGLQLISIAPSMIGYFGYCYSNRKVMARPRWWKYWLPAAIILNGSWIGYGIIQAPEAPEPETIIFSFIANSAAWLPIYWALYRLGYGRLRQVSDSQR